MTTFDSWEDELYHHGIKNMKWGVRRWQNPDGSLTEAGKRRYGTVENFNRRTKKVKDMSDDELRAHVQRLRTENEYRSLKRPQIIKTALDTVNKISENRAKKREQALREKELAVRLRETENSVKIAKSKAKESMEERKTYQTDAKRLESKARVKDARANLRRARNERKRMSIFQNIMSARTKAKDAKYDDEKLTRNINRLVEENNQIKLKNVGLEYERDKERAVADQRKYQAEASKYSSQKGNNKK